MKTSVLRNECLYATLVIHHGDVYRARFVYRVLLLGFMIISLPLVYPGNGVQSGNKAEHTYRMGFTSTYYQRSVSHKHFISIN